MAETNYLVITLRKIVPDSETGLAAFELVKSRLADRPDIQVTGHITSHFELGDD